MKTIREVTKTYLLPTILVTGFVSLVFLQMQGITEGPQDDPKVEPEEEKDDDKVVNVEEDEDPVGLNMMEELENYRTDKAIQFKRLTEDGKKKFWFVKSPIYEPPGDREFVPLFGFALTYFDPINEGKEEFPTPIFSSHVDIIADPFFLPGIRLKDTADRVQVAQVLDEDRTAIFPLKAEGNVPVPTGEEGEGGGGKEVAGEEETDPEIKPWGQKVGCAITSVNVRGIRKVGVGIRKPFMKLFNNQKTDGAGVLMYDCDECANENRVRVKARVTGAEPGTTVYLKTFDVDNPTSREKPRDDESKDQDNRVQDKPKEGKLVNPKTGESGDLVKARVKKGGEVVVELRKLSSKVTDNYRVCAACSKEELSDLETRHPDPKPQGKEQLARVFDRTTDEPVSATPREDRKPAGFRNNDARGDTKPATVKSSPQLITHEPMLLTIERVPEFVFSDADFWVPIKAKLKNIPRDVVQVKIEDVSIEMWYEGNKLEKFDPRDQDVQYGVGNGMTPNGDPPFKPYEQVVRENEQFKENEVIFTSFVDDEITLRNQGMVGDRHIYPKSVDEKPGFVKEVTVKLIRKKGKPIEATLKSDIDEGQPEKVYSGPLVKAVDPDSDFPQFISVDQYRGNPAYKNRLVNPGNTFLKHWHTDDEFNVPLKIAKGDELNPDPSLETLGFTDFGLTRSINFRTKSKIESSVSLIDNEGFGDSDGEGLYLLNGGTKVGLSYYISYGGWQPSGFKWGIRERIKLENGNVVNIPNKVMNIDANAANNRLSLFPSGHLTIDSSNSDTTVGLREIASKALVVATVVVEALNPPAGAALAIAFKTIGGIMNILDKKAINRITDASSANGSKANDASIKQFIHIKRPGSQVGTKPNVTEKPESLNEGVDVGFDFIEKVPLTKVGTQVDAWVQISTFTSLVSERNIFGKTESQTTLNYEVRTFARERASNFLIETLIVQESD